jgi:Concanavalin A-like lectin/glucanases superfamily
VGWIAVRHVAIACAVVAIAASSACLLTTPLDGFDDRYDSALSSDATPNDAQVTQSWPEASTEGGADATSSKYAVEVLADEPVLYFRFGERAGETKVRDEVSGLVVNLPLVGNVSLGAAGALTNESNTAVTLADDGRIDLPAGQEFDNHAPFTVELWVKQTVATPEVAFLIDHEVFEPERVGWSLFGGDGFGIQLNGSSGAVSAAAAGASRDGWHHVAGVMEGPAALRIYVDGVPQGMHPGPVAIPVINAPYSVGHQNCTPCLGNSFIGALDELAIYSKALSRNRLLVHINAAR